MSELHDTRAAQQVSVGNSLGMHLRVAGKIAQLATGFNAEIVLRRDSISANAKSIMSVLSLAAPHGTLLNIEAEGPDAEKAVHALVTLIAASTDEGSAGTPT